MLGQKDTRGIIRVNGYEELEKEGKYVLIPIFESDQNFGKMVFGVLTPWHIILPPPKQSVSRDNIVPVLHCGQPILNEEQFDQFFLEGGRHLRYLQGTPISFSICRMSQEWNREFMIGVYSAFQHEYLKDGKIREYIARKLSNYKEVSIEDAIKAADDAIIAQCDEIGVEWNFHTLGGIILYSQIVFPDGEKLNVEGDLRSDLTRQLRERLYGEKPDTLPVLLFSGDVENKVESYGAKGVPDRGLEELRATGIEAISEAVKSHDPAKHETPLAGYILNRISNKIRQNYLRIMQYDKPMKVIPISEIRSDERPPFAELEGDEETSFDIPSSENLEDSIISVLDIKSGGIESPGGQIVQLPSDIQLALKRYTDWSHFDLGELARRMPTPLTEDALRKRLRRLGQPKHKRGRKKKNA